MNPNSQHQLWSHWVFTVLEAGRSPSRDEVKLNAARWIRQGFGSAGRVRVRRIVLGWRIDCLIEGPPAHDPAYVNSVRRGFARFVEQGWGTMASGSLDVRVMAGSLQDGSPAHQMIELPTIRTP